RARWAPGRGARRGQAGRDARRAEDPVPHQGAPPGPGDLRRGGQHRGERAGGEDGRGDGTPGLPVPDAARGRRGALMDHLWAPWRREFVESAGKRKEEGCIFCTLPAETGVEAYRGPLLVARTATRFPILNRYPYNNGHLMVVPRRHTGDYASLEAAELADLQRLLQISLRVVEEAYHPGGANL